jgi:hypothetical protein
MAKATFVRRANRDSTTDSICLSCYRTIARAMWESELDRAEDSHECDPRALQQTHYSIPNEQSSLDQPGWRVERGQLLI